MPYKIPEFTENDVQQQINKMWDLSGSVPIPKFELSCHICGHDQILMKHLRFHLRNNRRSNNPYRCDVGMKCTACSNVWQHGLVIPEEMFPGKKIYGWRWIKEQIESTNQ